MKTLSIFEEGYEKGKAEAEKMHLEFVEKLKDFVKNKILPKYELACDWLGEPVSDKVNEVTVECLNFDIVQEFDKEINRLNSPNELLCPKNLSGLQVRAVTSDNKTQKGEEEGK